MYIFFDKSNGNILDITYPVTDPDDIHYRMSLEDLAGDDVGYKDFPDASGTETNISELVIPDATWDEIDKEREDWMDGWLPKISGLIALADEDTVAAHNSLKAHYASVKLCASGVVDQNTCIETIRSADSAAASATGYDPVFDPSGVSPYKTSGGFTRYTVSGPGTSSGTYVASNDFRVVTKAEGATHAYLRSSQFGQCIYYKDDWDGTGWCIIHSMPWGGWVLAEWDGTTDHDLNGPTGVDHPSWGPSTSGDTGTPSDEYDILDATFTSTTITEI